MGYDTSLTLTLIISLGANIAFYVMAFRAQRRVALLERVNLTLNQQIAKAHRSLVDATTRDESV